MPFPFFKKKKPSFAPASAEATAGKKAMEGKKAEKIGVTPQKVSRIKKPHFDLVGKILISPHISEKGTFIREQDQYIFRVAPKANKTEIKKAVESLYGVDVLSVNTVKIPKKKRRLGKTSGFKKGYKKAIIKLKENQKIDIFPK